MRRQGTKARTIPALLVMSLLAPDPSLPAGAGGSGYERGVAPCRGLARPPTTLRGGGGPGTGDPKLLAAIAEAHGELEGSGDTDESGADAAWDGPMWQTGRFLMGLINSSQADAHAHNRTIVTDELVAATARGALLPDDAEELYRTARTLLQLLQAPPPSEATAVVAALEHLSHSVGPATQPRPACRATRGVAMSTCEFASGLAHACLDRHEHERNESPGAVGLSEAGDGAMGPDDERNATRRHRLPTDRAALSDSSPGDDALGAEGGGVPVARGAPGHRQHAKAARKGWSELGAARELLERARFLDPAHEPAGLSLILCY